MGKSTDSGTKFSNSRLRPGDTSDDRQKQCIMLAYDRAEQQLIDGTASSQVITHFLKMGTVKEQLEIEKIKNENLVLQAKAEDIQNSKDIKILYADALKAFSTYSGQDSEDDEEYDEDDYD